MFSTLSPGERVIAVQRLTALWALNECGIGGIMHAFDSPFTGLIVGSIAMICIALICGLAERKWTTVMSSLLIVLIIKALVSPHSSPTAYIAVSFQAITGAIIFSTIRNQLISSVFFVVLGLLESASQKLLMMTIVYGNSIWEALNSWGDWVMKKWSVILSFTSTQLVIYIYLFIHCVAGIMVGWFIYKLIKAIHVHWGDEKYQLVLTQADKRSFVNFGKQKK